MSKEVKITCPFCESKVGIRLVYYGVIMEHYGIVLGDQGTLKLSEEPKSHETEKTGPHGDVSSADISCPNCGHTIERDAPVFSGRFPKRIREGIKEWIKDLPEGEKKDTLLKKMKLNFIESERDYKKIVLSLSEEPKTSEDIEEEDSYFISVSDTLDQFLDRGIVECLTEEEEEKIYRLADLGQEIAEQINLPSEEELFGVD